MILSLFEIFKITIAHAVTGCRKPEAARVCWVNVSCIEYKRSLLHDVWLNDADDLQLAIMQHAREQIIVALLRCVVLAHAREEMIFRRHAADFRFDIERDPLPC